MLLVAVLCVHEFPRVLEGLSHQHIHTAATGEATHRNLGQLRQWRQQKTLHSARETNMGWGSLS